MTEPSRSGAPSDHRTAVTAPTAPPSVFALPPHLAAKADPERIAGDERRFAVIAEALAGDVAEAEATLAQTLARTPGDGQGRVERDATVEHLRRRLRGLRSFRHDAVLGRMTPADGGEPLMVGRLAVHDREGRVLLLDWRSPAAEPFFAATRADPRGLASRRRYRWSGSRIRDYWDEALREGPTGVDESPDEESALLASLAAARGPHMRSVLSTLAADQDEIIRAEARGPLVVDGGPGTGKTVVALHRAAYLLYAEPRLRRGGGVLVIGPHQPYLHYVADLLPSLGEDDVLTATLDELVPEGAQAREEQDPRVALLKGGAAMLAAIDPAVGLYEEPPTEPFAMLTTWGEVLIVEEDWADAFSAPGPGTPHNLAREEIWEELAEIVGAALADRHDEHPDPGELLAELRSQEELAEILHRAWPLLRPTDLVADLYEVPAYLRRCAPALDAQERALLAREDPRAWTRSDLPLLDAARHRLGDPGLEARRSRQSAARQEKVAEVSLMLEDLIASDSSEMKELSMLRGEDLRNALEDATPVEAEPVDRLAGPFAHIVVDEAQELDDAQWAMILRRCPSRSLTLVGDRAQAEQGFPESWQERLARVGLDRVRGVTLSLNYRTPREIMEVAAPLLREALPEANIPVAVRESGIPVHRGRTDELLPLLERWLVAHEEGTVCVISEETHEVPERVKVLSPGQVKGLEFDLVVLMDPVSFGDGLQGAVAQYVAMTRSTSELVVLEHA